MENSFIIKKEQNITSNWFGGTSSQLFIYPENATLKGLDFDFRLSTATIEIEQSDFTSLPSVNRTLLLLKGELELKHDNHHSTKLLPFEQDKFKGDWKTISYGKAIDFNLMTRGNCKGEIIVLKLTKNSLLKGLNDSDFTFFYLYSGDIKINNESLQPGDMFVFQTKSKYKIETFSNVIVLKISIEL